MEQMRELVLRGFVLGLALLLPLGLAIVFTGPPPASLELTALDQWSPVREPGPTTAMLAQGLTLAGVGKVHYPAWFAGEEQKLLHAARGELERNKLQAAMGHLLVLSSKIEDQGRTLSDFLPIVVPDLAAWIIANYFAPILLGTLLVALTLLIFGPWLAKRFYDFLRLLTTLILALIGIGLAASLCFTIASQKALVFALIEYLAMVAVLLSVGNLAVSLNLRRRARRFGRARHRARIGAGEAIPAPSVRIVVDPAYYKTVPPLADLLPSGGADAVVAAARLRHEPDRTADAPETALLAKFPVPTSDDLAAARRWLRRRRRLFGSMGGMRQRVIGPALS